MHLWVLSCWPFKTFYCFHLGRSPIIIRPLWKLFSSSIWASYPLQFLRNPCISHHLQNLPFGLVTHYNETILRNLRVSHHFKKSLYFSSLWKIFMFFTWACRPLQQNHFEKSLYFSPFQKNLRKIFAGRSSITIKPPQKTFF